MIKEAIQKLAMEQVKYKPQRKTIHFKGKRIIEPDEAAYKVANNNYHLRHLYIAYDIIRGKEPHFPKRKDWSKHFVEQLVEKYSTND